MIAAFVGIATAKPKPAPAPVPGLTPEGIEELGGVHARRRDDLDTSASPAGASPDAGRAHGTLEVGANDIVLDCSPELATWLGIDRAELIGVHLGHLDAALQRRFGELTDDQERRLDADVVERTVRAGSTPVRSVALPVRDEAGWIRHVVVSVSEPAAV